MPRGIITLYDPKLKYHSREILSRSKNIIQNDNRNVLWIKTELNYAFGYLHCQHENDISHYSNNDPNLICTFWGEIYNKTEWEFPKGRRNINVSRATYITYIEDEET